MTTRPLQVHDEAILRHIRSMPKIELHRHLEGSIRFTTLRSLFRKEVHKGKLPAEFDGEENAGRLDEAVRLHFCVSDCIDNLTDFLDRFEHTQRVLCSHRIVEQIAFEVCEDAALDNVVGLELRYSPVYILRGHTGGTDAMTLESVHAAVVRGVRRAQRSYPLLAVGLIGILDRCSSVRDATDAAEFFIANRDTFVGVDLANDEERYDGLHFIHLFRRCREAGLAVTVHAGEIRDSCKGSENVRVALESLHASRIGHGIRVVGNPDVTDEARRTGAVFEVCPTSNVRTGTVKSLREHPLRTMIDNGLRVTISTDDPGLFLTDVVTECAVAVTECGMSLNELWCSQLVGYNGSFIPKGELGVRWEQAVREWMAHEHNLLRVQM